MDELTSKIISPEIASKSILMIGPMCAGKSTISDAISSATNMPKISLDNRHQLKRFYDLKDGFKNFKDFEFFLTCSVLTSIQEPMVIDFGAGHSVYENPLMFYEFQKLMGQFSNIVYMLPNEDKEKSIDILNHRLLERNPNESARSLDNNRHFVSMPCNEQLATIIEYTEDKSPEQICNDLLVKIQKNGEANTLEVNGHLRK